MKAFVGKEKHSGRIVFRLKISTENGSWWEAQRGQVSISNGLPQPRERFLSAGGGVPIEICRSFLKSCKVGIPRLKKELRARLACAPRGGWQEMVTFYFLYGATAWSSPNLGACSLR